MAQREHLEAFDDVEDPDTDFASEHQDTTVDPDVSDGSDKGETESPRGWDGMDQEGPP